MRTLATLDRARVSMTWIPIPLRTSHVIPTATSASVGVMMSGSRRCNVRRNILGSGFEGEALGAARLSRTAGAWRQAGQSF